MNLLEELKPYQVHIDAKVKGYELTDTKVINALLTIWDEFKNLPDVSKQIFGSIKTMPPTDRGCTSCVRNAIADVIKWKHHIEVTRPYKLIPQQQLRPKPIQKVKTNELKPKEVAKDTSGLSSLTYKELRAMAKSLGITTHAKKRPQIEAEINGK